MAKQTPANRSIMGAEPEDIAKATTRLIQMRWGAGILVLVATAVCVHLLDLPLPAHILYPLGVCILAYNAVLVWVARKIYSPQPNLYLQHLQRFVVLQVALDWVSMTVFLHLTGGVSSPAIPIYAIHMLSVTILLPSPSPYIYIALGVGALVVIAVLERMAILPHYTVIPGLPPGLQLDLIYTMAQIAFFTMAATATVHLATLVMTRLREHERQVTALLETTQTVSSTLSLPEVLERLAISAAKALATSRASIRLLDETGEHLHMAVAHGLSEEYQTKGLVDVSRSQLDREALGGKVVIVKQTATDHRIQYPEQVLKEGIGSILVAPIIGRGSPLGVLRVYAGQSNRFTAGDAHFVLAIAQQGAVALENALAHETLQQADKERAQFVRTITHELRAPVSGAQSLLRVLLKLRKVKLNPQQRDILARVEARFDFLATLINDLLALAASKTAGFQKAPKPIDLQPILEDCIDQLAHEISEKQISMDYAVPDTKLTVCASAEGVAQIFSNLIGNAVKYTPPDGELTVHLTQQTGNAVITISDTGIGIPAIDLPHLWDEFFRASNARRSQIVGTGLGLSIVKRLVDSYGGMISVQSVEGKGTTFTVSLPITPIDEPSTS